MFSGCTMLPDSSDQEASPLAGKNNGLVLGPCCSWKCDPTAISGGVDIPKVPGCLLTTDEFSVRVTKITSRIVVL